jgi:hypothetical protein
MENTENSNESLLQDLALRLQRLEDIEAIKVLNARYGEGADDENNVDIMVPLFWEDGVWDGGERFGRHEGHEAIRQLLQNSSKFITRMVHYYVYSFIDVAPDGLTAKGSWYLWELAHMKNPETLEWGPVWISGIHAAEFAKSKGEWKFTLLAPKLMINPFPSNWDRTPFQVR